MLIKNIVRILFSLPASVLGFDFRATSHDEVASREGRLHWEYQQRALKKQSAESRSKKEEESRGAIKHFYFAVFLARAALRCL